MNRSTMVTKILQNVVLNPKHVIQMIIGMSYDCPLLTLNTPIITETRAASDAAENPALCNSISKSLRFYHIANAKKFPIEDSAPEGWKLHSTTHLVVR